MFSYCEGQKYHDALCLVIVKDRNTMTRYFWSHKTLFLANGKYKDTLKRCI